MRSIPELTPEEVAEIADRKSEPSPLSRFLEASERGDDPLEALGIYTKELNEWGERIYAKKIYRGY